MKYLAIVSAILLTGCITMSGRYTVSAIDAEGKPLTKMTLIAEGSGIYTMRNALCKNHPKAVVLIKDQKTGEQLKGESPYQCP